MKNKKVRVAVMIILGLIALSIGQGFTGILPNIMAIVGAILFIGGVVEAFKKQKPEPPKTS